MKVSTSAYARQTVSDRLRRLLFQSSALGLGVSIAVLKAGVAEAQLTGCNVETNTIDCPQGTYASISAASEGDMTITIAPGSTVEDLELVNENGATADLSLLAPGVDFTGVGTISGQSVILLNAATAGTSVPGDINVVVGTVSTGGDATSGIVAMGRNINITAESSATANANAFGIYGDTAAGAVTIHSGTVSTFGDLSTGILGRANIGTVDIVSGSVTAAGAGSYGILGTGGGDINITSEDVLGYGPVDMTTGQRAIGIAGVATSVPENRNGNVIIDSELARYHGHGSIGIYGATLDGDVTINSELITANASRDIDAACLIYLPAGIVAESETGDITVNSGVIRGDGRPGPGLQAPVSGAGIVVKQTTGLVTINSEEVFTSGRGSAGITTAGVFGDVVINSNRVSTGGLSAEVDTIEGAYPGRGRVYADAIEAISLGGSVTVNSERASAESGDSQAITIIAAKNATLNSATAETLGEGTNAIGISVENGIVDVTLTGNTRSIYGTGVSIVAANDSDVDVDIGAEASIAARDGGLVIVTGTGSTVVTNRGRIETAELVPGSVVGAAISVDGEVGSSITINNYGTIVGGVSASGAGGVAITFSDAVVNETLNLFTGSSIVGLVDGRGGVDTLNLEGTVNAVTPTQGFGDIVNFETINANSGYWVQAGQTNVDTINVNGGALVLTGTAAGDATIAEDAILQIGAGGTTGSLDGDVAANGTLIFHREDDYVFAGGVSGNGSLIKRGAGLVRIDGLYTFTGATAVDAGTLKISQLAGDGDLYLTGGSLDLSGGDQTAGGLNGSAGSSVNIDDGSLTIIQGVGESSTFGGSLVGNGALNISGGGAFELNGVSTYSGPTTVEGGLLLINGAISSSVTVNGGAVLGGSGVINGSTLVRRNGIISPGNSPGVLTIAGPLTLSAGSTFLVEVDPTGPIVNDRLDVGGAVTIENGARLEVNPQGSINLYERVNQYTIINAGGGLFGAFAPADVTSSLALLTPRLQYEATRLNLHLVRNDIAFSDLAETPNQVTLATAAEATGDGSPVYAALVLQSDQGLRAGYDALSGEGYGSAGSFLAHEAAGGREGLLRQMADVESSSVWFDVVGSESSFDSDSGLGSADVDASSAGYALGWQAVFDQFAVGGSFRSIRTDLDVERRGTDMTIDSTRVGVAASSEFAGITGSVGVEFAQSGISANRTIVFPGVAEIAMADFDATQSQVFGELSMKSNAGTFVLEPFVGFAALQSDMDGFDEDGPLGLTVKENSRYITFASAGLRFAGPDDWLVKTRASLSLRHADGDVDGVVTSAFAGGSNFDVIGANVARDVAVLEVDAYYSIADNAHLSVGYAGAFGSASGQQSLNVELGMRF